MNQERVGEKGRELMNKPSDDQTLPADLENERLWAEEAERRVAQIRTGQAKLIPGDEVFAKIRSKCSR